VRSSADGPLNPHGLLLSIVGLTKSWSAAAGEVPTEVLSAAPQLVNRESA